MSAETAVTRRPAAAAYPGEIPADGRFADGGASPARASFAGISGASSSATSSISSA